MSQSSKKPSFDIWKEGYKMFDIKTIENVMHHKTGQHLFLFEKELEYVESLTLIRNNVSNPILNDLIECKTSENFECLSHNTPMFFISHRYPPLLPLSFKKLKALRDALDTIHSYKKDDQFILILYYLEHPALALDTTVFPQAFRQNNTSWSIQFFSEKVYNDFTINSFDNNDNTEKYDIFYSSLYRQLCSSVEIAKEIKNNVHFVNIKPKGMETRQDYVKFDSIKKINAEKENYDWIQSNKINPCTYNVRNTCTFRGEFTSAISSCGDTINTLSLEDVLKNYSIDQQDKCCKLLTAIFDPFDQLYSLEDPDEKQDFNYIDHLKTIITTAKITYMEHYYPVSETQHLNVQSDIFNDLFNFKRVIKKCYFKIIDISPVFDHKVESDDYKMLLEFYPQTENNKKWKIVFKSNKPDWKDTFTSRGIKTGTIICCERVEMESFFVNFYNTIHQLKKNFIKNYTDEQSRAYYDKNFKNGKECFHEFETISLYQSEYLNPAYGMKNNGFLNDILSIAHGDANLNNIIIEQGADNLLLPKDAESNFSCIDTNINAKLIDFAAFGNNYPIAFDMVKMEIKNHVLSKLLKPLCDKYTAHYIDLSIRIEEYLYSDGEEEIDFSLIDNESIQKRKNEICVLLAAILQIRNKAFERYQSKEIHKNAKILYLQQLFFYSLKTLSYRISESAQYYAAISVLLAAQKIFTRNEIGKNGE